MIAAHALGALALDDAAALVLALPAVTPGAALRVRLDDAIARACSSDGSTIRRAGSRRRHRT